MSDLTTPSIYVACLSAYASGILHGVWLDATDHPDTLREQIRDLLAASPEADAQEWAIHDTDNFAGLDLDEHTPLDVVHGLAVLVEDQPGDAVAAWVGSLDTRVAELDPDSVAEDFAEHYRGTWPSLAAFAADLLEEQGVFHDASLVVVQYFDYDAYAHDLELERSYWTAEAGWDSVHVFTGD